MRGPATLCGFPVSVADVGDEVHLCHPLLAFEGDSTLYVAHVLDWADDTDALDVADLDEASTLGTLLPPTCRRPIVSGEGVVAVGADFVRAAATAGVELGSEIRLSHVDGLECRIGVATPVDYAALTTRLDEEARLVFDEALGDAVLRRNCLSARGNAALLIIRRCSEEQSDALAIRELAGAWQSRQLDLYRRLLIGFAFELDTAEDVLEERVERHLAWVERWRFYQLLHPWPTIELDDQLGVFHKQVRRRFPTATYSPKVYDFVVRERCVLYKERRTASSPPAHVP